jgi:hypothetical protein
MTRLNRRVILSGVAGCAAAAPLGKVRAALYPDRPITLVVPFAPGGSTDILARIVAEHLYQALGQPVIVENRSGASGNIGTAVVARSAPDGYTFLFNTMSVHTMNHALFAAMPFDGVKDFSPITLLAYVTNTMVLHPAVPANNVREFIATRKRIRERFPTLRPVPVRPTICAVHCLKRWRKSPWCTCLTVAEHRPLPTRRRARRNSCLPPARRASST